jgi:hypothetical protein
VTDKVGWKIGQRKDAARRMNKMRAKFRSFDCSLNALSIIAKNYVFCNYFGSSAGCGQRGRSSPIPVNQRRRLAISAKMAVCREELTIQMR